MRVNNYFKTAAAFLFAGFTGFGSMAQVNFPCDTTAATKEFEENWSGGQGNWTGDIGSASGEWNTETGSTISSSTGPNGPHAGSQYMYFEASSTGTATMVSPAIDLNGVGGFAMLTFWLHGYGDDIPGTTLEIAAGTSPSGPFTNVYSRTFSSQLNSSSSDPYVPDTADLSNYIDEVIYLEITYSTSSTFHADLAIDLLQVWACGVNDAGVSEITAPSVPNCTDEELYVNLTSINVDPLTSVEIHWSVDGVTQQPRMWTGYIPPFGNSAAPIYVGTYPFQQGQEVKAWTFYPNGADDEYTANDTAEFEIPTYPTANLPDEVLLCEGETERLETGLAFKGHNWSTGEDVDPFIDVSEGGIYAVTVTDGGSSGTGCEHFYEVSVIEDVPVDLPESILRCEIDGPVTLRGNVPNKSYFWNTGQETSFIDVSFSGEYWVEATDPTGKCISTDTVDVEFDELPEPEFTARPNLSSLVFTNLTANADDYFWEFGDGNTSTEEGPTHLYQNAGEYEVFLTATNRCGSSTTSATYSVDPASVEDIQNAQGINVYPNPNSGQFNVAFSNRNMEDTRVEILDMQGRMIQSETVGTVSGTMQHEIELNDVAPGMYLLKILSQDELISINRVSVQ